MRSFVIENIEYDENDEETLKSKIRREMCEKLASEWNEANRKIEEASWKDENEVADEADYLAEMADESAYEATSAAEEKNPAITKEELKEIKEKALADFYAKEDARKRVNHDRLEVIEELLGKLGARMMRPYEHWNEDEKYMEYMENRYDNEG